MPEVVRFHEPGGPEVLRVEDLPAPEPGPGEVRLRVEAIGLNRAEIAFREGRYLEAPRFPARLGYEAAGVVDKAGPGVTSIGAGQAVGVVPCFSMNDYATYAELAVVPARAVVPVPPGLDPVRTAAVWMAYLTAWGGLVVAGGLQRGEAVVIPAASSSVGHAAIQVANRLGAVPIAATRTGAKREVLLQAGAAHVVATGEEDLPEAVMAATGGEGAALVFDPVAGPYVETLAKATRRGGTLVIYGGLSGQATPFPARLAMSRALSMRGYTLFEVTNDDRRLAEAERFVLDGLAGGSLRPVVDRVFHGLRSVAEAQAYMAAGGQNGKIVVALGGVGQPPAVDGQANEGTHMQGQGEHL